MPNLNPAFPTSTKEGGNALWWRYNERDGVSNHQPHDCLLSRLFRRRSKKISKLLVTGLCEWNSLVTGEIPAQRASDAEIVSFWWRHHGVFTGIQRRRNINVTRSISSYKQMSLVSKGAFAYGICATVMCIYVRVFVCIHMYKCMYIYTYICTCTCIQMCIHVYSYAYHTIAVSSTEKTSDNYCQQISKTSRKQIFRLSLWWLLLHCGAEGYRTRQPSRPALTKVLSRRWLFI